MSRCIILGRRLGQMTTPELRQWHTDITAFADSKGCTPEERQRFWGDDLDEIAAEIRSREPRP